MAINVGDCVVKLGLDKTQFTDGMRKVGDETDAAMKKVQTNMRIGGAAILAVGAAGLKLVSDARKMNAELGQVAITTGMTTGEMRGMALGLSNVTFRLKSVISTLDLLTRAGVRDKENLIATANAFDALGDATGAPAEVVADQLIPAFQVFGLELPKTSGDLDKFTWLAKNTLINLSDFASVMDYVAMYGGNLNVTLDQMVAIMAILNDRGVQGAAATRLFRTAVSQASDGTMSLNEALGISNQVLDDYVQKISIDATGATEAYAAVANEQYGIMDKLASVWERFVLVVGSLLTPLEPVFGLMSALGPLLMAMSLKTLPELIANLKASAIAFAGYAVAAAKAVAALVAQAAAAIWATLGPWGIAGIALATAGVIALIASIRSARAEAEAAIPELAEGGIVTRPTRALIGEAGPEAVIPLSRSGVMTREIHIHVGNFMGDETSMRQFIRMLDQKLKEEGRRSAFGQVNQGWFYGRSSL